VVVADECAQGHGVLRSSSTGVRAATRSGRATVAIESGRRTTASLADASTVSPLAGTLDSSLDQRSRPLLS
jgi:hypothetical protein